MAMTNLHDSPAALPPARALPHRATRAGRPQRRRDVAIEVANTMLILALIAAGIVALRCVLVVVNGLLQ
jgi:hypothetical protein